MMLTITNTTRNSVPQRGCAVGIAPDGLHRERVLVFEGVDGHVLRAVVLEHAPHLGRPAHHQQVAHEEHHADERLGEALEDGLVAAPGRRHARLGQEERQQDEDADGDGEGHAAG